MALEDEDEIACWETALLMGESLEKAPYHIKTNEGICIMAINYDPKNLKYIPEEARSDIVVFTAIDRDPNVAKYITDGNTTVENTSRQYDLEVLIPLLSNEITIVKKSFMANETICAPKSIKGNVVLARQLIEKDALAIAGLDQNVRANKEIAFLAINKNWKTVVYLDNSLYDDYEVMSTALINSNYNADVFLMASDKLKEDPSFAIIAVSGNYKLFKYLPSVLSCDNIFIRELIKICDPHFMKYVHSIDIESLDMLLSNPKFKICCCNKLLLLNKKIGLYMISKRPELAKKLPLYYCNENILSITKDVENLPKLLRERVEAIQTTLDTCSSI